MFIKALNQQSLNASEDETIITSYAVQRNMALASGNFDATDEFDEMIVGLGRKYSRLI